MMDDSKKRFQIGFIGSLGFHLFVFLVLAFAGLFSANHVDDKIVEIAVFGGGGGGGGCRHRHTNKWVQPQPMLQKQIWQQRRRMPCKINSRVLRSNNSR